MIKLRTQHRKEIGAHGERDYPHECCGLLLGAFAADSLKTIAEIYPISNAREEGLLVGASSGANVFAALRLAQSLPRGSVVVTILCDGGEKYLD